MADKKISALTASTVPLAGSEVLPIVQSGATVKVAVADLTAGRAISATQLTLSTENLIIGTSGKGIDFSATPGTGTSELLADYEEGTWTPAGDGVTLTLNGVQRYTKIGRVITIQGDITFPTTVSTNLAVISGLPYTAGTTASYAIGFTNETGILRCVTNAGAVTVDFYIGAANATNVNLSTKRIIFSGSYTS
jgi:hypothetical protein